MAQSNKSTLRIDWFDGTVIEESQSLSSQSSSEFIHENTSEPETITKPAYTERKLMGFKRLLDLSQRDASNITLQLSGRTSFWDLLQTELKNDIVVLIVKIIAKLFTSLQAYQKSVVLTNLLKTKFLPSTFIETLCNYMLCLPDTRIVEKRMNMMFWDDVESFYWDVLKICDGISLFYPMHVDLANTLIEATGASINGVIEEHKEMFSKDIFNKIISITKILEETPSTLPNTKDSQETSMKSTLFHFSTMNIFPTRQDIFGESSYHIEPNIVNGAYASVDHYLDLQFKLLREDYFGPLREGITKYIENPIEKRHENIRVHSKVRIIRTYVSNNKVGYLVDLAWKERLNHEAIYNKALSTNKHLMFGSLLLFTCDGFQTILCGTVLDSNINLLKNGYIAVSFHTCISNNIFSESFVMVESEVFFEPYHRVLKVLQDFHGKDIPMSKYIVDVQPDISAPSYLTSDTMYTLLKSKTNTEICYPVLHLDSWPNSDCFGLDMSQFEAFKLALTREFAVIQGPPGTGKTFIGIKVASTLLQNLSLEGTPMLVICYTNHALDQFLEGILSVTKNIIRLGSQSKNEAIEPFTLNNLRGKSKSKYSYLYTSKRLELETIYKDMMLIQDDIEKCNTQILDYNSIKPFLKINSKMYELNKSTDDDPINNWLFNEDDNTALHKETDDTLDDWEQDVDENTKVDDEFRIQSCFSEEWAEKELMSMQNSIKYVADISENNIERDAMINKFENQVVKLNNRLDTFKNKINLLRSDTVLAKQISEIPDLYTLASEDRWLLYFQAANLVKQKLSKQMTALKTKHDNCSEELEEVASLVDSEVVKTARVVGATTTMAARRHALLQMLNSPIVIIEEAGEVLEAHIIASLTHHCKHVILIGDHKQLRPTAAHYKLAKNYNLDISLFERMIQNGIHARTLTTQRRMLPIFADLIVPAIYEKLDNHPKVYEYPNVRGMVKSLYFINHNIWEDEGVVGSWSHKHSFEANWCVALAYYLRQHNYSAQDVTILATYNSQATYIREVSKKFECLKDCKVTVVDNYQGEESKIIILSLVRSNIEGKIGFLAAQNRICVALSRAKEGFYIVGNMGMLTSASPIWKRISEQLMSHDAIGSSLTLNCYTHPENTMTVSRAEDLEDIIMGQCLKICEIK